jgi:hypothetical protein
VGPLGVINGNLQKTPADEFLGFLKTLGFLIRAFPNSGVLIF